MSQDVAGTAVAPTFIDEARRYRELGGERPLLVDYLRRCGVDATSAEQIADRFDVEICLSGNSRPLDISPAAARTVDSHHAQQAAPSAVATIVAAVPPMPAAAPSPSTADSGMPVTMTAVELANGVRTAAPATNGNGHAAVPSEVAEVVGFAVAAPVRTDAPVHPAATPVEAAPPAVAPSVATPVAVVTLTEPQAHSAPAVAAPAPAANPPTRLSDTTQALASATPASARAARPSSASEAPDTTEWDETTEFGYKIAQSWDDDDPNAAINQAASLKRAGHSHEQIVEYLIGCNVSEGEAEYVASMTGARRTTPKETDGDARRAPRINRRRAAMLGVAMIVAGGVVAYLGYHGWEGGTTAATARSPLSLAAVGLALALNGLRTLVRR